MRRRSTYRAYDPEPCTIDGAVVAEFLEENGRPRMASWARSAAKRIRAEGERERELREVCKRLRDRLEKYEPTPPWSLEPSYKPRPEASD